MSQNGEDTGRKYQTYEEFLESIKYPKNPKRLRFAIRNQKGQVVGGINITPDRNNQDRAEIGYYLGAEFIRKGHMTRALDTLANFAFNTLNCSEVYGVVSVGNAPSVKVLQRAGFGESKRFTDEKGEKIVFAKSKSTGARS